MNMLYEGLNVAEDPRKSDGSQTIATIEKEPDGRSRTHISRIGGKWDSADADPADFLVRPIWYARRSIRYTADG